MDRNNHVEKVDLWTEADIAADAQDESDAVVKADTSQVVIQASADCLLDELIWKVDSVTPKMKRQLRRGSARRLGRLLGSRFHSVAISSTQVANQAVEMIAAVWPIAPAAAPAPAPVAPESVGEALLVRAGAFAAVEASAQVAEAVLDSELSPQTDLR